MSNNYVEHKNEDLQNEGISWADFMLNENSNNSQENNYGVDVDDLLGENESTSIPSMTFLRTAVTVQKSVHYPHGIQPAMFVCNEKFAGSVQQPVKFSNGEKSVYASTELNGLIVSKTSKHYVLCGKADLIQERFSNVLTPEGLNLLDKFADNDLSKKVEFPITALWGEMKYHQNFGGILQTFLQDKQLAIKSKIFVYWSDYEGKLFRVPLKTYNVDFAKLVTNYTYTINGVKKNSALENMSIITPGDPFSVGEGNEKTTIFSLDLKVTEQIPSFQIHDLRESAIADSNKKSLANYWYMLQPKYTNMPISKLERHFLGSGGYTYPPFNNQLMLK